MAKKDRKSKGDKKQAAADKNAEKDNNDNQQRDNLAEQEQNFESSEYVARRDTNTALNDGGAGAGGEDENGNSNDKQIKHEELLDAMQSLMDMLNTNSSSLNKLVHVILGGNPDEFDSVELEKLKAECAKYGDQLFFGSEDPMKLMNAAPQSPVKSNSDDADDRDEDEETTFTSEDRKSLVSEFVPVNTKRKIYVKIGVTKVGDVNTISMVFNCAMMLQFRWHEPSLDKVPDDRLEQVFSNSKNLWNPDLLFDNVKNEKCTKTSAVKRYPDGKVYVLEKRKVSGDFVQALKLVEFPMDSQMLAMIITTEKFEDDLLFEMDPDEESGVNIETFAKKQEWDLHKNISQIFTELTDAFHPDGPKHPAMTFLLSVDRKPGFFFWNIFMIMAMICGLSFALFSVPIYVTTKDGIDSRLKLGYTLVLTSITFRNTVTKNLPPLAYLTGMDKYLFSSMIFLYFMNMYHICGTFAFLMYPTSQVAVMIPIFISAENYVLIAFGCVYGVQHITLIGWINIKFHNRKQFKRELARQTAIAEANKLGK